MAIENENIELIKLLLEHNIKVQVSCGSLALHKYRSSFVVALLQLFTTYLIYHYRMRCYTQ